jgi:NMD protein affecting ribosome stability and mRNA decay
MKIHCPKCGIGIKYETPQPDNRVCSQCEFEAAMPIIIKPKKHVSPAISIYKEAK